MSDPVAGPATEIPDLPSGQFVFVSVGTDHHPFDRLVDAVERWTARSNVACYIQSGTSRRPDTATGLPYLPYPSMAQAMEGAVAVVCHGGPATIMLARQCGRIPIVVPRDPERGEHVDGHQQEFARWMAAKGQVVLAESTTELGHHLDAAIADPERYRVTDEDDETADAVARFSELVDDLIDRKRAR